MLIKIRNYKVKYLYALLLLFLSAPLSVVAQTERITSFDVTVQINHDSSIKVTERIVYDFGENFSHGIFRDIPVKYKARGGNYNLRVSDIWVADEYGVAYLFEVSQEGKNRRIKIGDPDILVSGEQVYVISYLVKRALNYFDEHDELYWNVTGNEWPTHIGSASATVILPQAILADQLRAGCFAGLLESTSECRSVSYLRQGNTDRVSFRQPNLTSGEGLTVVVGFPKGIVAKPSKAVLLWDILRDNSILFLPVLVFIFLFYNWQVRGRDPKASGTIVAQYEPPAGLSPAEVGTIADEHVQTKDVTATILDLAVRGYLKIAKIQRKGIIRTKTDYELIQLKPDHDLNNHFEKMLLNRLFDYGEHSVATKVKPYLNKVTLSQLKNKFFKDLREVQHKLYETVVLKGYFPRNPQRVRSYYYIGAAIIGFGGLWLNQLLGALAVSSLIATGILIAIFGRFMPARTLKGARAQEWILGLKEYLSVAEKDRLTFHNAPVKSPERFEKLLPYAMVLGVEKQWASQFEGIYRQSPSWYSDPSGHAFSAIILINSLDRFSSTADSALAYTSRSAASGGSGFGGGFSGGGFGGGGGGSW